MSSVKLDSRDSACSTRIAGAMKVPDPQRWTRMPFSTRPASAFRTVTREMPSWRARSRSLGSASSALSLPAPTASWISR